MYYLHSGRYDWLLCSDDERHSQCFLNDHRLFCRSTENNNLGRKKNARWFNGSSWSVAALEKNQATTDDLIE